MVTAELEKALSDAGVSMYQLEARLLEAEAKRQGLDVDTLLHRRLGGEPIAYITGEWEFYSIPVFVTRDTLIPRPDTEALVDRALELLRERRSREVPQVLDLCAGTGCVGLAIAENTPVVNVMLGEISEAAITVCRRNIKLNGLEDRVAVQRMDALEVPPESCSYDMILCNPPYITTQELKTLDSSVRDYEPRLALDGGEDGLRFYRAITTLWHNAIVPGGRLLFEVGYEQASDVAEIMRENGYKNIVITRDLNNIERVIEGETIER